MRIKEHSEMATKQFDAYSDLITFTRASTATYLDSDGLLKSATTNTPRIEYDADGNKLGLLIEEARTNSFTNSEDFTNAVWIKSGVTVTSNTISAPDGTTTADLIEKTTADSTTPAQATSATAGQTWVWSVFVKDDASTGWLRLRSDNSGSVVNVFVNYKTGVVGTGGLIAGVLDFGNGWKRVYAVRTTPNTNTTSFSICPVPADGGGDPTGESVYFWGAQLEAGSFPTSYIPTAGATATRAADVASIPTSAFGYNQKAGTVVCEFDTQFGTTGFPRIWEIGNISTGVNRVNSYISASFSTVRNSASANSVGAADLILKTDPTPASGKLAFAFADNDFAGVVDGGSPVTDTSGSFTTPSIPRNTLKIGGAGDNSGSNISGHLKSIQYFPRRLTNTQIQRLTE
jgi:hypothetical protein